MIFAALLAIIGIVLLICALGEIRLGYAGGTVGMVLMLLTCHWPEDSSSDRSKPWITYRSERPLLFAAYIFTEIALGVILVAVAVLGLLF